MSVTPPEKILSKYQSEFGKELGELFYALWNELIYINSLWAEYKVLYNDQMNIEVLNKIASSHFKILQNLYLDRIMLGIAKVTDHKNNKKGVNASIRNIEKHYCSNELKSLIKIALQSAYKIRKIRHRRIGHYDFNTAIGKEILPNVTYECIDKSIQSINKVINTISQDLRDTEIIFSKITLNAGAETLINFIKKMENNNETHNQT